MPAVPDPSTTGPWTMTNHRVRCKAVVVAAGSINTAKLLLQSTTSDSPDGLGNTHGVLGYYLHDHPAKVQFDVASPISFLPPAYVTRHPLERSAPLDASACMQWGGVSMLLQSLLSGRPGCTPVCGLNVFVTMAPSRSNFVALDRDKTLADGTPGLILNIHHPPDTERSLVTARGETMSFFEDAGLQPRLRHGTAIPLATRVIMRAPAGCMHLPALECSTAGDACTPRRMSSSSTVRRSRPGPRRIQR
jgi:hypothetical protein